MDEIKTKQQVVEKIKESAKILVTVSDSPSVDALSAALALTMVLDKQEKYATAIFSGETPPAIAFLEPEKTFDDTTDSLRDFIIALNKEKADHLRYKVEGDAVKIFITPYKTTITQDDLEFSQGDYNVELVIAIGVDKQENLDKALENHGQILHDAAIITMTAGDQTSDLGGIDWHDSNSSSLSEMVAGLAEALKEDKKKPLIDAPIATALLTGVVAETDRFSNEHTTSKAMTVAASLMAAGADQQLIATELQASRKIEVTSPEGETESDVEDEPEVEIDKNSSDGSMTINKEHDSSALAITHDSETLADLDRRVRGEEEVRERVVEEAKLAKDDPEGKVQQSNSSDPAIAEVEAQRMVSSAYEMAGANQEPVLGGTLNATTDQAAEDSRREMESDRNKTILEHSYLGGNDIPPVLTSAPASVLSDTPEGFPGTPSVAPGSTGVNDLPTDDAVHEAYSVAEPMIEPRQAAMGISGERVVQPIEPAPVSAYSLEPPTPAVSPTPADLGLPLPPPIPDFSQFNSANAPAMPIYSAPQPAILGDILAPEPPAFTTTNAVAAPNTAYAPEAPTPSLPPLNPEIVNSPQSAPADPGQFQIPPTQ